MWRLKAILSRVFLSLEKSQIPAETGRGKFGYGGRLVANSYDYLRSAESSSATTFEGQVPVRSWG